MASKIKNKRPRNTIIFIASIVAVAGLTMGGLWIYDKINSERKETKIAEKVEEYKSAYIKTCTGFVGELNALSEGLYTEKDSVDESMIKAYIDRLEGIQAPDEEFRADIEDYLESWLALKDNYTEKKYDETVASLSAVKELAGETSSKINSKMDAVITKRVEAYERELREEI